MKRRIFDIAHYTGSLLRNINCDEEYKNLEAAENELSKAISGIKELDLDQLCAIEEDKRQELTTRQQAVIESYAKLKRILLETYRDIFNALKGI